MRRGIRRTTTLVFVGLLALLSLAPALAYHERPDQNHGFANIYFERTWERVDKPVKNDRAERTWIWGPDAYTSGMFEEYADSPGERREVQYYDKSRMEINHPEADDTSIWYVTNGLLVNELVSGMMQVGDAEFDEHEPAEVNVAGDPDDPDAVTYADLAAVLDDSATPVGSTLITHLAGNGHIMDDPSLADDDVTAAHRVTAPGIDHTIASPFWEFMNSSGTVYTPGMYYTDELFINPFYATGYPVTEAYWTNVDVAGADHLVLLQCFERRCLTYTPENPDGWQVEFGNVGQHYYRWRHVPAGPVEFATVYLVQEGVAPPSPGRAFGCGDELVPVQVQVLMTDTLAGQITNALNALLAIDEEYYGESGLKNALWQNDATVEEVDIDDGVATVHLSGTIPVGGVCDEPRVVEQLRAPVLHFPDIEDVVLLLNGLPLFGPPVEDLHFTLDLGALNGSGVTGTVALTLAGDALQVEAELDGLAMHLEHPIHIHGLAGDVATCPTAAHDSNGDGIIDLAEGGPAYGDVLVDLTPYPIADHDAHATLSETYTVNVGELGPLDQRVVVVHGMVIEVDGEPQYDASVPVACGLVTPVG